MSETREARLAEIVRQMRNEKSRYKSHDLGYVDSVSASSVDEWADELEALSTPPEAPPEPKNAAEIMLNPPPFPELEAPPEPPTPTLQTLAAGLGWGNSMTDEAIVQAVLTRERLLRLAQELLETHKSVAWTAEDALRERIAALQGEPPTPEPERPAARCVWKKDAGAGYLIATCNLVDAFIVPRPAVAHFRVCPYCTKPLTVEDAHA